MGGVGFTQEVDRGEKFKQIYIPKINCLRLAQVGPLAVVHTQRLAQVGPWALAADSPSNTTTGLAGGKAGGGGEVGGGEPYSLREGDQSGEEGRLLSHCLVKDVLQAFENTGE